MPREENTREKLSGMASNIRQKVTRMGFVYIICFAATNILERAYLQPEPVSYFSCHYPPVIPTDLGFFGGGRGRCRVSENVARARPQRFVRSLGAARRGRSSLVLERPDYQILGGAYEHDVDLRTSEYRVLDLVANFFVRRLKDHACSDLFTPVPLSRRCRLCSLFCRRNEIMSRLLVFSWRLYKWLPCVLFGLPFSFFFVPSPFYSCRVPDVVLMPLFLSFSRLAILTRIWLQFLRFVVLRCVREQQICELKNRCGPLA